MIREVFWHDAYVQTNNVADEKHELRLTKTLSCVGYKRSKLKGKSFRAKTKKTHLRKNLQLTKKCGNEDLKIMIKLNCQLKLLPCAKLSFVCFKSNFVLVK